MSSAKQLLVIDDEPNVCAYLKDLLEYFGYAVTVAQTCKDALERLKQQPFDALLLDLYMRNESGETVLRWLQALGRPEPVVMMCSMPHYALRIDLIFKGAADLLGKPIQPTQLRQVLLKAISQAPGPEHEAPAPGLPPALSKALP